jgi:HEPN domain-containing protein
MGVEEIEILKERAEKFLKNGEYLLSNEVFDLAAFNIQQFVELYLKYRLFLLSGDYPKTRSIKNCSRRLEKLQQNSMRYARSWMNTLMAYPTLKMQYNISIHPQ